mmetsp:Transcript_21872/g.69032  ORF Transcript_21872/g.69032 Transcript_21872/m.69032 type:complete len:248 (+) Transcript_21872:349-1092(+)
MVSALPWNWMPLSARLSAAPKAVPKVTSTKRMVPVLPGMSSTPTTTFEASPLCHCAARVWPVALKMAPVKKSARSVSFADVGMLETTTLRFSTSAPGPPSEPSPRPAVLVPAAAAIFSAEAAMRSAAALSAPPRFGSLVALAATAGWFASVIASAAGCDAVAAAAAAVTAAAAGDSAAPEVRPRRRFFQGASPEASNAAWVESWGCLAVSLAPVDPPGPGAGAAAAAGAGAAVTWGGRAGDSTGAAA